MAKANLQVLNTTALYLVIKLLAPMGMMTLMAKVEMIYCLRDRVQITLILVLVTTLSMAVLLAITIITVGRIVTLSVLMVALNAIASIK